MGVLSDLVVAPVGDAERIGHADAPAAEFGGIDIKGIDSVKFGTLHSILTGLREEIEASTTTKLGGLLIRPAVGRLRARLDPDTYGGAYLLGLKGLVVIAHGNSSPTAIANAIRLAARGVEHDIVGRLAARLSVQSNTV